MLDCMQGEVRRSVSWTDHIDEYEQSAKRALPCWIPQESHHNVSGQLAARFSTTAMSQDFHEREYHSRIEADCQGMLCLCSDWFGPPNEL
jgi:hypothetical protein